MPLERSERESKIRRHDDLLLSVDGVDVAITRYEPVEFDGPLPVVVMAIPYRKDDRITYGSYLPSLEYLTLQGYEVVVVDLPGTGASSGRKPVGFDNVGAVLASVIERLAEASWSNGRVGMYGKSYGGLTQLMTAAERPPSLEAIVPVEIVRSPYGLIHPGGVYDSLRIPAWSSQMHAFQALPPSRRDADGRWARIWDARLDELSESTPWLLQQWGHEEFDDYWERQEIEVENIEVPALVVGGYRDIHTRQIVEYFEAIDAPKRLLLGPWRHTIPHRGRESAIDFRRQAVEWFDRFLKDEENGALEWPRITYWTEREGGWEIDAGDWRGRDSWPTASAEDGSSFAISPSGLVPANEYTGPALETDYEFDATVGTRSLQRVGFAETDGWDTTPDDNRSLTVETEPLDRPVELTGSGRVTLRLEASTSDPVVAVRVNDVRPDGTARVVTTGHCRASRCTPASAPDVGPGDQFDAEIDLDPRSHVFESGHRIRLTIASAAFPRTFGSPEHGQFTLRSAPDAPSMVTLPGLEHPSSGVAFEDTVEMRPPDTELVPVSSEYVTATDGSCEISREMTSDAVTFSSTSVSEIELPHDATLTIDHRLTARVASDDPGSAAVRNDFELTLEYDSERVRVDSRSRVSQQLATVTTTVDVDGAVVFDEEWRRSR